MGHSPSTAMRRLHLSALPAILTAAALVAASAREARGQSPESVAVPAAPAQATVGPEVLTKPQPFRVGLVADHDGGGRGRDAEKGVVGELVGQVVAWDDAGFDATVDRAPKRVRWDEVSVRDLQRLRKRLIEQLPSERRQPATAELVAYLLSRADEDGLGTRMLEDLERGAKVPTGAPTGTPTGAESIRARAEAIRAAREAALVRAAASRLQVGSPEASVFQSVAWPPATPESQAAAVAALRAATRERLAKAGRDATPVESTHCLAFSLLSIEDAAKRATEFDAFIAASLVSLGEPREANPWQGRLVIIVSENRDQFTLIEAAAFGTEARSDEIAVTHYDGPHAFVHLLDQTDAAGARPFVLRAIALALLHRHRSAVRLPAWAHEGLADWLVAQHRPTASLDPILRREGLSAVRARGGFGRTIEIAYAPGAWPFRSAADRGEAYVLTSFLMERSAASFLRFVTIVKSGEPWRAAIRQAYGREIDALLAEAWAFHRVND
jgi:hypothetical protein